MKRKIIFLSVLLLFGVYLVSAQQSLSVSGVVTDAADGSPLIGVSVQVKGTTSGTITDFNGKYSLQTTQGSVLVFSYIGMKKQEITVNSKTVNVKLESDAQMLEEYIAIGYGTMKKSDLTGSVSSLSGDKLNESIVTNVDQILKGRVAGVQVQANSGAPGAANTIRIRGTSSINGSNEPLYIIDGIPMGGAGVNSAGFEWGTGSNGQNMVNPLAAINPGDIIAMDILKDASATAIYGSAGANGVVIVTTKRGQEGHSNITYDGYVALQVRPGKLNMMNLREFGQYQKQLYDEGFLTDSNIDQAYLDTDLLGTGTDWQDAVTRDAWMQSHNVSMTGGTNKTQYALSIGYTDQTGIIINSDFNRFSGRINLDQEVRKGLKIGGSLAYTRTFENIVNNDGINGVIMQAALMSPSVPVYDFDGNYAGPETTNGSSIYNPVALTQDQTNSILRGRIMGNIYASIDITPWMNIRSELGIDGGNNTSKGFKPSYTYGRLNNTDIQMLQNEAQNTYWNWKNFATVKKTFNDVHNLTFMAGTESSKSSWEWMQLILNQLPSNDIRIINGTGNLSSSNGGKDAVSKVSFFGRANYDFDGRYLLTATMRADASSKFGANNRWGYFPSFAGAWRISDEEFMENSKDWLSNMKLRAGWGMNGNDNIDTYLYGSTMLGINAWNGTAYRMANNANPNLKWEASVQYNAGLDIAVIDGRIDMAVDVYYKTSNDLLLRPSVSPVLGGSTNMDILTPMMNIGQIDNKGLDISLNTHNIKSNKFNWHSNLVFSLNRNKVVKLDDYDTPYYGNINQMTFNGAFTTVSTITVGQPIGVFYGYQTDGLYTDAEDLANSAKPTETIHRTSGTWIGDVKFVDQITEDTNGDGIPDASDGVINEKDQVIIGDPNPDFTFGFTNTFTYKNWELGIGLTGSYGADILNYVRVKTEGMMSQWDNQDASVLGRARIGYTDGNNANVTDASNAYLINPDAAMPRWSGNDINGNNRMSDRWIEDGSYLRIQNISLAYNLPEQWIKNIGITGLKIYANAQNVYTFTKYSGLDPEIGAFNQGTGIGLGIINVDLGRYPQPRIFTLGVNVTL